MQEPAQGQDIAEVVAGIRRLIPQGAQVSFISGVFNVVHPGHVRLLKFATDCSDFLVVGVLDRYKPAWATTPADLRLESVRAISMVDQSVLLEHPVEDFIRLLQPDIVLKGREFENQHNCEAEVVASYGGRLIFASGEMSFSSLDILDRDYFEGSLSSILKPMDFPIRHRFSLSEMKNSLAKFSGLKVLVVGDVIVDEYIDCDALGMSQEDATIVVRPISCRRFVGGSGIVAAHAAGLGAKVRHFSIAGDDSTADYVRSTLDELKVETSIVADDSRPTTLKKRYRASGKTLLRVSDLRQHAAGIEIANKVLAAIEPHIADADLLVFSDFNYGCLPQSLVERLVDLGRDAGVAMVADSQASSQVSDISRFKDMLLITPTEREARLALQDWDSGLIEIIDKLQFTARAANVVITLGAEGSLIYAKDSLDPPIDRLPALNSAPKDVAGAGDSLLITASMALCVGADIWQASYLGAIAAACQVSRVGNTPLSVNEIVGEIDGP